MSDLFGNHIVGTHMTSLFSCGKLCVIRSVMTLRVLTFLREYGNFHWKYAHFEGHKIIVLKSYDRTNLTLVVISCEIY